MWAQATIGRALSGTVILPSSRVWPAKSAKRTSREFRKRARPQARLSARRIRRIPISWFGRNRRRLSGERRELQAGHAVYCGDYAVAACGGRDRHGFLATGRTPGTSTTLPLSSTQVGKIVGRYDKIHLVPFGEYIPFQNLLTFAHKLTGRVSSFTRGSDPQSLSARYAKRRASSLRRVHLL